MKNSTRIIVFGIIWVAVFIFHFGNGGAFDWPVALAMIMTVLVLFVGACMSVRERGGLTVGQKSNVLVLLAVCSLFFSLASTAVALWVTVIEWKMPHFPLLSVGSAPSWVLVGGIAFTISAVISRYVALFMRMIEEHLKWTRLTGE